MKHAHWALVFLVLSVAGCAMGGHAGGPHHPMAMHGQDMDSNGDGVVSKDEFMQFHERMFDRMKNQDGVLDLKSMPNHGAAR